VEQSAGIFQRPYRTSFFASSIPATSWLATFQSRFATWNVRFSTHKIAKSPIKSSAICVYSPLFFTTLAPLLLALSLTVPLTVQTIQHTFLSVSRKGRDSVEASASGKGVHEGLPSGAGLGWRKAQRRGLGMAAESPTGQKRLNRRQSSRMIDSFGSFRRAQFNHPRRNAPDLNLSFRLESRSLKPTPHKPDFRPDRAFPGVAARLNLQGANGGRNLTGWHNRCGIHGGIAFQTGFTSAAK